MPPEVLAALEEAYARWGTAGIFLSRFLPGLRAAVPPFAGVAGLSPARALVPAAVASAIWYAFLAFAGYALARELGGGEGPRGRHQPRPRDRRARPRRPRRPLALASLPPQAGVGPGPGHATAEAADPRARPATAEARDQPFALERRHGRPDALLRALGEPAVEEGRRPARPRGPSSRRGRPPAARPSSWRGRAGPCRRTPRAGRGTPPRSPRPRRARRRGPGRRASASVKLRPRSAMRASAGAWTVARRRRVTDQGSGTPTFTSLRPIGGPALQHAVVGGEGEDAAAGHGGAADRGHHRLRQAVERPDRDGEGRHEALHRRPVVLREGDEVEAGAEELRVGGGEEDPAHAGVGGDLGRGPGQLLDERLVDRVAARLVHPQDGEPPLPLDPDSAHRPLLVARRGGDGEYSLRPRA